MPFSIHTEDVALAPRAGARRPQVELEILRGSALRRVRRVAVPVFLIGADADCDLVLGDPQFPEVHSYLFLSEEGVWVRYLGLGPALAVEGRLVKSAQVYDGETLRTGSYEFRIGIGSPRDWQGEDGNVPAPAGRFALAARKHRRRTAAGLSVVQELMAELQGAMPAPRGERAGVA